MLNDGYKSLNPWRRNSLRRAVHRTIQLRGKIQLQYILDIVQEV